MIEDVAHNLQYNVKVKENLIFVGFSREPTFRVQIQFISFKIRYVNENRTASMLVEKSQV